MMMNESNVNDYGDSFISVVLMITMLSVNVFDNTDDVRDDCKGNDDGIDVMIIMIIFV